MQQAEKFGWRVPEWAKSVGLSRAYVYELMKDGRIRSVKADTARIITTHPQEYLASLAGSQKPETGTVETPPEEQKSGRHDQTKLTDPDTH